MCQTKQPHGKSCIDVYTKSLETTDVFKGLVHHGQANDGIDYICVGMNAKQYPGEQGNAVPQRKQAHIQRHIFEAIQKENDSREKQQVIVAGDHVLGAKIQVGDERDAVHRAQVIRIAGRDAVRQTIAGKKDHQAEQQPCWALALDPVSRTHRKFTYIPKCRHAR